MKRFHVCMLLTMALLTPGCAALGLSSLWKGGKVVADDRHPVIELMCLWEPAEGTGLDNLPTRGFRGQVLFFTAGQPSPAEVDGDVRVIVFDQEGPDGDPAKPIHQFDFPGEAWNAFLTTTNFGNAYQLFIPYTKKGNQQAECEIRVRYTPKNRNPVHSRPCAVALPGAKSGQSMVKHGGSARRSMGPIVQASHEEAVQDMDQLPTHFPGAESIRMTDAEAVSRVQDANVHRLHRLADELAEESEAGASAPRETSHEASGAETSRRRLHPLAAEASENGSTAGLPEVMPLDDQLKPQTPTRHPLAEE